MNLYIVLLIYTNSYGFKLLIYTGIINLFKSKFITDKGVTKQFNHIDKG